jgi:hypothetical protein
MLDLNHSPRATEESRAVFKWLDLNDPTVEI